MRGGGGLGLGLAGRGSGAVPDRAWAASFVSAIWEDAEDRVASELQQQSTAVGLVLKQVMLTCRQR